MGRYGDDGWVASGRRRLRRGRVDRGRRSKAQKADACDTESQAYASDHNKNHTIKLVGSISSLEALRRLVVVGFGVAGVVVLVAVEIALVDDAQAGEGEAFVDLADEFGTAGDKAGKAAGSDGASVGA